MSKRKSSTESKPFKVLKRSLDQNIEEDIGFIDESEYEDILNLSVITMSDDKKNLKKKFKAKTLMKLIHIKKHYLVKR